MIGTSIYITMLNHLGGFEYFLFKAQHEYNINVEETGQTRNNILPNWPNSYGMTADTIDRQTYRKSKHAIVIKSQFLTANQRDALSKIRTLPLVQIVYSRNDRRTVLVNTDSFKVYSEDQDTFSMQFTVTYTDDIPSQRV